MASETRRSFKDRAKDRLPFSFKLKKSPEESVSSREDLTVLEGEIHGRENPLAWENLPSQLRDRLDPFSLSLQGEVNNAGGNNINTIEYSGPMGPITITSSKPENKKRTLNITQPKGTLKHSVKTTDTLSSIAAMYDTTPSELKKLNKLMTTTIFPDQVIYVPDKDYIPSEPSSPVNKTQSELCRESQSGPDISRDKGGGPVEVPVIRQTERQRTKSDSGPNRSVPGAAQRVLPRPLSEAEAERMDQECLARFIKVNVKHITDGQGVVSGVLLVTPNAIMFDPNVSDPLVKELGADQYGVIAPMEIVISAAMYHDIAAMKLKGVPKQESGEKPQVYHAPSCPLYKDPEAGGSSGPPETPLEPADKDTLSQDQGEDGLEGKPETEQEIFHRKESARHRRKEHMHRTCSCGALSQEEFSVTSPEGASVVEEVEECTGKEVEEKEGEIESEKGVLGDQGSVDNELTDSIVSRSEDSDLADDADRIKPQEPQESQEEEQGILSRTLGSISSFGSSISPPNFTNLVDFSSGLFSRSQEERGKVKDIHDSEATSETSPSPHPSDIIPARRPRSPTTPPFAENVIKLDDKPDLFRSLNELIPKPAQQYEDPPLYLCLKIGKPLNKKVPQHGPIESYMKNRPKSEYWFSIPRDKVDALYAFFVQWSPNIYGGDDDIDPRERGFVMVDEEDTPSSEGQPRKTMDIIDDYYRPEMKKLTRQMTKDWEIVNIEEYKRRQLVYDEDKLPLPELSHPSVIMTEDHIRTLSKNLHPRAEGYPWKLVYSSDLHGFSLKTLYRSMLNTDSHILMILKDTRDTIFGAMLSCAVRQSEHFYGTGECYLFTFQPDFKRYNWTGSNNFFIKGETDSLEIGAGDGSFGLWLDGDLYHGRTQKCDTFDNEPLTATEDFVLKGMEAWAFV